MANSISRAAKQARHVSTPHAEQQTHGPPKGICFQKLNALCRRRYVDGLLPDSEVGRGVLTLKLWCGLKPNKAMREASWSFAELSKLQCEARALKWNKAAMGKMIALTFAEFKAAKMFFFLPCDVTPEDVTKWLSDRKADTRYEASERHNQKKRDDREPVAAKTKREDAVLLYLRQLRKRWVTVSDLMKQAVRWKAFRRSDGSPLRNLCDAMHSTLNKLAEWGAIEIIKQKGKRGPVSAVRLIDVDELENQASEKLRYPGPRERRVFPDA